MREEVLYRQSAGMPGLVLSTAHFSAFRFEPHYHLDWHLALVTDGVQRQTFRGGQLTLGRGAIQLMPPGEVHDGMAEADASYTLRTFRLSSSLLSGMGREVAGTDRPPSQAALVLQDRSLANRLLELHATLQRSPTDPLLSAQGIIELFESLFARIGVSTPLAISGRLTPRQFSLLRDFIDARLPERILLEDMALLLDVDRFRFLKLFKRTVGMTPHAWLLRLRLEKAVELMKTSRSMSITSVAHAVGFFDQSHFTRVFRAAYGATPRGFQQATVNFLQGDPSSAG